MKKVIALLSITSLLVLSLAGCGGNKDAADNTGDTASNVAEWDDTSDITIVSREDGSGTRGAFIELFGIEEKINDEKVDQTTEEAQITNSTYVMLTTVAKDEYAIGYVSLGALDDSVKALKIDGAEATAENIKAGTYKVSLLT